MILQYMMCTCTISYVQSTINNLKHQSDQDPLSLMQCQKGDKTTQD